MSPCEGNCFGPVVLRKLHSRGQSEILTTPRGQFIGLPQASLLKFVIRERGLTEVAEAANPAKATSVEIYILENFDAQLVM